MKAKKIRFIPGATEAMRKYALDQYEKLLSIDGTYDDFQVNTEVVDGEVERCIPRDVRSIVANEYGKAIWGLCPFIESPHCEKFLPEMINRLDAIVEWCDAGNEFDIWEEYDEATGKIVSSVDQEEE